MTVFLDISRISKRFITDGAVFEALKDVDLKIAKGVHHSHWSLRLRQINCSQYPGGAARRYGRRDFPGGFANHRARSRSSGGFSKSRLNALVRCIRQCGAGG